MITSHSFLVYIFWVILGGASPLLSIWYCGDLSVPSAGSALTGFDALVHPGTVVTIVEGITPFSGILFSLGACWTNGVEIERFTCAILSPAGTGVQLKVQSCFTTAISGLIEEFNDHFFGSWSLNLLSRVRNSFLICCQSQNRFD